MFAWVDNVAVDVSRRALPIMKSGHAKGQRTQLENLEHFYTALGAFTMTVGGDRCCVYISSELCTFLNKTMNGIFATPAEMFKTIMTEYVELMAILDQIMLCSRRLSTMLCVLRMQSTYGRELLHKIRPHASSPCAFNFVDYISESYRKALERFDVYNERINCHIYDVKSIVEYMERPTHDPSNTAVIFDAIVSVLDVCASQRASIAMLMATCRYQVSPDVIASQLQICNDHMCSSLELCASVYNKELTRCRLCTSGCTSACSSACALHATESHGHCVQCVVGLRNLCTSIKSELV